MIASFLLFNDVIQDGEQLVRVKVVFLGAANGVLICSKQYNQPEKGNINYNYKIYTIADSKCKENEDLFSPSIGTSIINKNQNSRSCYAVLAIGIFVSVSSRKQNCFSISFCSCLCIFLI